MCFQSLTKLIKDQFLFLQLAFSQRGWRKISRKNITDVNAGYKGKRSTFP